MTSLRRILGIDPGSRITGFGVIEQRGTELICLTGGCIRLSALDMPTRLGNLFAEVQEIVRTFQPTELAIEQVFVHKNVSSALKLGQARGVVIAAVMAANLTVHEYAPRAIKQAVVGKGCADKSQVQHMIQILLKLGAKPQSDAADALAAAVCHLHTLQATAFTSGIPRRARARKRSKQWMTYDRTTSR